MKRSGVRRNGSGALVHPQGGHVDHYLANACADDADDACDGRPAVFFAGTAVQPDADEFAFLEPSTVYRCVQFRFMSVY